MAEVEHRPLVLAAGSGQPGAAEGKRGEGRLEQDPLLLPLVHVAALHDALPAAHVLLEAGADPAGGMDVQVAADRSPPSPERSSSSGVPIAPAATITARGPATV